MPILPRPADRSPGVTDEWSAEPNLDLLRSIAVLCVVARHVTSMLGVAPRWWFQPQALGIFGVLVFFVHTSLVLMVSLDRQWRSGDVSAGRLYAAFLVRRFFRIYPLSVTAVLLAYFVLIPFGDAASRVAGIGYGIGPRDLVANLLLVQDWTTQLYVLVPLWSLPAEVQMYLVLPALFFLVQRRGARAIALVAWPIAVAISLVAWKLDLLLAVGRYVPCFVAGVLCYGLLGQRRRLPFPVFPAVVIGLLLGNMIAYARIGKQAGLGIAVTLVLALAIPLCARMSSRALRRASHAVAKYSYGIYLFHPPCIWLVFSKLRGIGLGASLVCLGALIAATAMLSYRFIEAPLIRVGHGLAARILVRPAAPALPIAPLS
jgi:peptidoglycan/LPS O-acetylase OafA/YrhL